jgi:type IV pilus assembly protein PilB
VDGMLHTSITIPNYLHSSIVSRIKVLANLKLDETRIPQDGRIRVNVNGQEIDLRVSVLPMLDAEKVVMRVLDTSAGVPTLEELGFSNYHIEIIKRNITRPFGLFLLTGPTGSGKTTTLYSILNSLTSDEFNITTLEDPIEYYINAINQSQVNPEVGYTFSNGLRAILRQDPNIIMVGEIRDNETAELVVHAALTGHLVFSTLHTNNAWGAIPRMIDMKVEPFLLSSILNLVMAQRLVRKICPACKKEEKLPPKLEAKIAEEIKEIHPDFLKEFGGKMVFYKGAGCANCGNTGYVGRSVIGEILELGNELKDLIARDFTMEEIREQLKKQKFVGLLQDGIIKGLQGITTIEEVMRISQEQEMS